MYYPVSTQIHPWPITCESRSTHCCISRRMLLQIGDAHVKTQCVHSQTAGLNRNSLSKNISPLAVWAEMTVPTKELSSTSVTVPWVQSLLCVTSGEIKTLSPVFISICIWVEYPGAKIQHFWDNHLLLAEKKYQKRPIKNANSPIRHERGSLINLL